MFYNLHNPQIFNAIVTVNSVDVVNLLISLKRFDKSVGYQTMYQKTLATFCAKPAVAKPHFNVWLCAAGVFFRCQAHQTFRHRHIRACFTAPHAGQRLNAAKRAYLVAAFIALDVCPHFNTSSVALLLLHGFLAPIFLR